MIRNGGRLRELVGASSVTRSRVMVLNGGRLVESVGACIQCDSQSGHGSEWWRASGISGSMHTV